MNSTRESSVNREATLSPRSFSVRRFWPIVVVFACTGFLVQALFVAGLKVRAATGDAGFYFFVGKSLSEGKGYVNETLMGTVQTAYHPPGEAFFSAGLTLIGLNSPQMQRYALCAVGDYVLWGRLLSWSSEYFCDSSYLLVRD